MNLRLCALIALAAVVCFGMQAGCGSAGRLANPPDAEVEDQLVEAREIAALGPDPVIVTVTRDGSDNLVSFTETNPGDFNGDGEVSGLDVFPLAAHFGHLSNYNGNIATDEHDDCIDGNMDGVLDGKDLFLIAVNFQNEIAGYNVFHSANVEGPFETHANADLIPYEGCSFNHQFRHGAAEPDLYYEVHSAMEWGGDDQPPTWNATTGVQSAAAGVESAILSWNAADDDTPPVKYNVYYSANSPLNFHTATRLEHVAATAGDGFDWTFTVNELAPDTELHFAVRAEDSSARNNEETNVVELGCTPLTPPDETPPAWDTTTGIQHVLAGVARVTLSWNNATDADSPPVKYNVFYDTSGPINYLTCPKLSAVEATTGDGYDWRYTVTGLDMGRQYWFAVRAEDSADPSNEDMNAVELSTTAWADTTPPAWDTTTGIQAVQEGEEQVTVFFNNATDEHFPPVKYNVYWDEAWPFDFETANTLKNIEKEADDTWDWRYTVTGLTPGEQSWFVVRAEDSSPAVNEDGNTEHLQAAALLDDEPPVWDATTGVQDADPGDGEVMLFWNNATDAETPPVKYNVYWDDHWPFDFGSCPSLKGVAAQADDTYDWRFTVGSLTNDTPYWFVVRVEDSWVPPNEDANTVNKTATPSGGAGGAWSCELVDETGSVGWYTSLAFDGEGEPAISYFDDTNDGLKIARFDGTDWTTETIATSPSSRIHSRLAFDDAGEPMIAWVDMINYNLNFSVPDGESWDTDNVYEAAIPGFGNQLDFKLDDSGDPAISFCGHINDQSLRLARYDGGSWTVEDIDDTTMGAGNSLGFDADGDPAISYQDGAGLNSTSVRFAWFDGADWNLETIADNLYFTYDTSCAFSPTGVPYVAFDDPVDGSSARRLRIAFKDGASWSFETVDADHDAYLPRLVFDPVGNPAVSYDDNNNLFVARMGGSTWSVDTLVCTNQNAFFFASLAFGPDGNPAVSHFKYHNMEMDGDLRLERYQ